METRPAESNYFMDLTRTYPKSPKETLLGLVHLPRMIDKAKAFKENNLGEYIYPCPLDKLLLNFFIVDYEEFAKKITSLFWGFCKKTKKTSGRSRRVWPLVHSRFYALI